MSRAKKPTLKEKKEMVEAGLIWKNWLVLEFGETTMKLVNRASGKIRKVKRKEQ